MQKKDEMIKEIAESIRFLVDGNNHINHPKMIMKQFEILLDHLFYHIKICKKQLLPAYFNRQELSIAVEDTYMSLDRSLDNHQLAAMFIWNTIEKICYEG